jgi:hypothetical protein
MDARSAALEGFLAGDVEGAEAGGLLPERIEILGSSPEPPFYNIAD